MRVVRTLRLASATSILIIAFSAWPGSAAALDPACRAQPTSACMLEAVEQAARLLPPGIVNPGYDTLAVAYARLGRLDKATAALRRSTDANEVLISIAVERAQAGRFDEALQIARRIREPEWLVLALLGVARVAIKAGEADLVRRIADEAGQAQANVGGRLSRSLAWKAEVLVWRGRVDEALQLAGTVTDADDRSVALRDLVFTLIETGRIEAAARVAGQITEPLARLNALVNVAGVLARAGQDGHADALFEEAGQLVEKVGDKHGRVHDQGDKHERVHAQVAFVSGLARGGRLERAAALAGTIGDAVESARALAEIGERYMRAGQAAQARRLFQQAADSVAGHGDQERIMVIEIVARAGDLDEAVRLAAAVTDKADARTVLAEAIARGAAANGRYELARRFIGTMPVDQRAPAALDLIAAMAQAGVRDRQMALVAQAIDLADVDATRAPLECRRLARSSCVNREAILAYRFRALAAIAEALAKAGW
jgi:tetratricopeptide (TPR) repeat protein